MSEDPLLRQLVRAGAEGPAEASSAELRTLEDDAASTRLPAPAATTDAAPPEPVVDVQTASLGYGRRVVLKRVDMAIGPGDFWCLLGANGEGKTTLIKALLGALRPRRGQINVRFDFARRNRVGYVPQHLELNPALPTTVREFVLAGTVGVGMDRVTRRNRYQRVMELVGMERAQRQNFWTLSGGQRQRAMVARALIRNPRLLVVDEPTAGLDPAAANTVLNLISELNRTTSLTVVFVTHDLVIAGRLASHVALLRDGMVRAGSLDAVFTGDNLSATFGVPVNVRREDGRVVSVEADRGEAGVSAGLT